MSDADIQTLFHVLDIPIPVLTTVAACILLTKSLFFSSQSRKFVYMSILNPMYIT